MEESPTSETFTVASPSGRACCRYDSDGVNDVLALKDADRESQWEVKLFLVEYTTAHWTIVLTLPEVLAQGERLLIT